MTTLTRDQIRAKVFADKKLKTEEIEFFGAKIEIRQMKLADILNAQATEDRESAIIDTLIKYAFIPGTDEKVFEEGDAASLKNMPFGADFGRVAKAMETVSEVNFLDTKQPSTVGQTST